MSVNLDRIELTRRFPRSCLVIWLDADVDVDQTQAQSQHIISQMKHLVNYIQIFMQLDECIDFLTETDQNKAFLITTNSIDQQILSLIHDVPQLSKIYMMCNYKINEEQWSKVKGMYPTLTSLLEALKLDIKQVNRNEISVNYHIDQLDPTFMYTQLFKEIILEMNRNEESIHDFVQFWRDYSNDNTITLKTITSFEREYRPESAIWWYTKESFIFETVNYSLRTLNTQAMIKMGAFIRDLHQQLELLHQQQFRSSQSHPFVVYRGQGLSLSDFETLKRGSGGLISFNSFLSTSKSQEVSLIFAEASSITLNTVGILFKISVYPRTKAAVFANIQHRSSFESEEEILFSVNTVFRIRAINQKGTNPELWEVQLTLTDDNDPQLATLMCCIREEISGRTGWFRMGQLMLKVGHFDQAEELYNRLLEECPDDSDQAFICHQLGRIKWQQGLYEQEILFYEKYLQIKRKYLSEDHVSMTAVYNNIGAAYNNMTNYSKALEYYERVLKIREKALPLNHAGVATCYNNIGQMYCNLRDYSKALEYCNKDLEISKAVLPSNHPDLATSYNNVGKIYYKRGDSLTALPFLEKALHIREKVLPPNHLDFAQSYNNIAVVYDAIGDYSKALEYYEKARQIYGNRLPTNHPYCIMLKRNISITCESMRKLQSNFNIMNRVDS